MLTPQEEALANLAGENAALRLALKKRTAESMVNRQRAWFAENPEAEHAYFFFDGHMVEESVHRSQMTSRTAQLVAIATDGFPVLISRASLDPEAIIVNVRRAIAHNHPMTARLWSIAAVRLARADGLVGVE